jgi:hypothetical protein
MMHSPHGSDSGHGSFPSSLDRQASDLERRRRLREQQEALRRSATPAGAREAAGGHRRARPPV